jgi:hypothetical protein
MALQVGELGEGFAASRVQTFVRFLASVRANVLLEVRQLCELTLADLAFVRFDARVDASMLG